MAEHLYNWEDVLDFVLADSGEQKSESDDELIADVEDESVEAGFLSLINPLYLYEDNKVSVTVMFLILLPFLRNNFMHSVL